MSKWITHIPTFSRVGDKPISRYAGLTKHLGFVYKITRISDGKFFIGKKLFWFKKGKKLVESDWKDYYGSSKDLKADVEKLGKDAFERRIIKCYDTKWDLMYRELMLQLEFDVMDKYTNTYNGIINVRLRKRKDGTTPKIIPVLPR